MAGLHANAARRYVRMAQLAGVGLGVMAVALWAFDVPGLGQSLPSKPVVQPTEGGDVKPASQVARISPDTAIGLKERLEMGVKRPASASPPPEAPQQTAAPVTSGPAWKYLGPINEARRVLALVSLDNTQKIIAQGATLTMSQPASEGRPASETYKATLVKVESDYIEIEESGKRRRIDLESRTAKVAWIKNMPVNAAQNAVPANMAGMSPEARQRLAAQGIDPTAAAAARLAAGQQLAGRNRGVPTPGVVTAPDVGMTDAAIVAGTSSKGQARDAALKDAKNQKARDKANRDDAEQPN